MQFIQVTEPKQPQQMSFDKRAIGIPVTGNDEQTLRGQIARVMYHDKEGSGFFSAILDNGTRIIGNADFVPLGAALRLRGRWKENGSYGRQFAVDALLFDNDKAIIRALLQSGFLKGVKEVISEAILNAFGDETFNVLHEAAQNPEGRLRLQQVRGIGPKNVLTIFDSWRAQASWATTAMTCLRAGLTLKQARKAKSLFGPDTERIIVEEPYKLTMVPGVTWEKADAIAKLAWPGKIPIPHDSPQRYAAATREVLTQAYKGGHLYLPLGQAQSEAIALASPTRPAEFWSSFSADLAKQGLVLVNDDLYLETAWQYEKGAADKISLLLAAQSARAMPKWETVEPELHKYAPFTLSPDQRAALKFALESNVVVITGGPGTGKTSILVALVNILKYAGLSATLCAPTGKAADRMAKATQVDAGTIHKVLGLAPGETAGRYPVTTDFLIIDEASMIDAELMFTLLRSLSAGQHLVLIGDADQLPPVGAGEPFFQVVSSQVPVARLTVIHRQGKDSGIVMAAHAFNHGIVPDVDAYEDMFIKHQAATQNYGLSMLERDDKKRLTGKILDGLLWEYLDKIIGKYQVSLDDLIVLSPVKEHDWGVHAINEIMQAKYNPPDPEFDAPAGVTFRTGDKVLHTRNNYKLGVLNGQTGIVERVLSAQEEADAIREHNNSVDSDDDKYDPDDDQPKIVWVKYDDRSVGYTRSALGELSLAYAMTIHKSQGSEFPFVVMVIPRTHPDFEMRQLAYTGLTRARKYCMVLATEGALEAYITNERRIRRNSHLGELIVWQR